MAVSESTGKAGDASALIAKVAALQNLKEFAELNWSGAFDEYLALVRKNPAVTRSAFQRVYDMILSYGQEEYIDNKKRLIRYNFFKDEQHAGRDAIFGLDIPLMRLVSVLHSAAQRYGTERRVILLHGPVGSSKSTIARLIKRGMEEYSRTPEGALYTYDWVLPEKLAKITGGQLTFKCPMHEEPLRLFPPEWRDKALVELGLNGPGKPHIHIEGDLDPACRLIFRELMTEYKGDWAQVVKHVRVRRMTLSEQDRVGIGTFEPKDGAQTDIDEVILGHTNEAEYKKLLSNEFMEALRDRTVKIDIPYITRLTEEIKIYEKDFNSRKIKSKHIAPHTLEVAAMWAVMTRLE